MFDEVRIHQYITHVINTNTLELEISRIQQLMAEATRYPYKQNHENVKVLNQIFKALLAQKALLHSLPKSHKSIKREEEEDACKNV